MHLRLPGIGLQSPGCRSARAALRERLSRRVELHPRGLAQPSASERWREVPSPILYAPAGGDRVQLGMAKENEDDRPEREQTDESLRAERERADRALGEKLAAIEDAADAVINKARARADRVLAAARATSDAQAAAGGSDRLERVGRKRAVEDQTLRSERAVADDVVRAERAEHLSLLSVDRGETDKDLSVERIRSDAAVASRDELLGIVSHDLRNLLATMLGTAQMIGKAEGKENHEHELLAHVQRILRAGGRMDRLIGDLIDLASITAGSLALTKEHADPAPVVQEAVDAFQPQASANGLFLSAELGPGLPQAVFDPARILQVLINLLSNAIKFTPADGKILVRVEAMQGELRFAVSDTGAGIPADKLGVVFERFLQLNPHDRRGVGLGLYISKNIVEAHGGRINATSTLGAGSTFYFTLPLSPG